MRVVDGVHTRRDRVVQRRGRLVQVLQQSRRVEIQGGQGGRRGAQPAHRGGGADAAAHHVADDERGLVPLQRDHVEPVPADLAGGARRLVPGGHLQAGGDRRMAGQQAALQGQRGVARVLVPARVVDLHGRAGGQLPRQQDVVLVEGRRIAGAFEVERAQHLAARDQRHRQIRVQARPAQQHRRLGGAGDARQVLVLHLRHQDRLAGAHAFGDQAVGRVPGDLAGRVGGQHRLRPAPPPSPPPDGPRGPGSPLPRRDPGCCAGPRPPRPADPRPPRPPVPARRRRPARRRCAPAPASYRSGRRRPR